MIEELYTTYRIQLAAYCRAMDTGQAEDLVQETFLRAMANLSLLESMRPAQVRSWLYKTARNLFFDRARRKKNELEKLKLLEDKGMDNSAFDAFEAAQLLLLLPQEEQTLFHLRYLEGYNAAELGDMYGCPSSTIRARLLHARQTLQIKLSEE